MLILDKRKAIERIVDLTAQADAHPEERPVPARGRSRQRVARFERSRAVVAPPETREQPTPAPVRPRPWPA